MLWVSPGMSNVFTFFLLLAVAIPVLAIWRNSQGPARQVTGALLGVMAFIGAVMVVFG